MRGGASVKSPISYDDLKSLQVVELIALKERIDRLIAETVKQEKRRLEDKLRQLQRYEAKHTPKRKISRAKPAPKYRNQDTGETWTGRGVLPKWLKEAIKAGKKKTDFLIVEQGG